MVLVEPQHPGNVGAAARAMRNFGLEQLILVAPPAHDPERARWMAPGCDELLAHTRIVASLDEALQGVHRVMATTARHRRDGHPVLEPKAAASSVHDDPDRVHALLFGREDHGLDAAAVRRCDTLVRIPTTEHASLNLGQAVLLMAHALFEEARVRGRPAEGRTLSGPGRTQSTRAVSKPSPRDRLADLPAIDPAAQELVELLGRVGYLRGTPAHKVLLTARQAMQRGRLSVRHVEALRGMVSRVGWALDHPDVDWTLGKGGEPHPDARSDSEPDATKRR